MARSRVWHEAYEQYLLSKRFATKNELSKLSDEKLSNYFHEIINKNNLKEDSEIFIKKWCMQYK